MAQLRCTQHKTPYCMKTEECRAETRDKDQPIKMTVEPGGQMAMVLHRA